MVRQMVMGWVVILGSLGWVGGAVYYVDDSAPGANNGTSWANAFVYLQDALSVVAPDDLICVAQGTYRPDQSAYLDGLIPGDRKASFNLKGGVEVRGGHAGFGTVNPDAREVRSFETILSGDLNGDDQGGWFDASRSENSFNVVTAFGPLSGAVLDGFTITGGYGGPDANTKGGGLCSHSTTGLLIRDCLFHGNFGNDGGGLYDSYSSSFRATECVFTNNYGSRGGGIYLQGEFCMTLDHCLIAGNQAEWGGGICLDEASASIVNCTIAQNHARDQWGGVIDRPGTSHFWSCIFWHNTCSDGTVEWAQIGRNDGWTAFDYCCVQGWTGQFAGVNTIDANPFFAKEGLWVKGIGSQDREERMFIWNTGDYHLMSQAGRWSPAEKIWVKDWVTSPCIDGGNPADPIMYEPFPNGGVVNMGFDGGTARASKSRFGGPLCEVIMAGDINGDCKVNLADFAILSQHWLWNGQQIP